MAYCAMAIQCDITAIFYHIFSLLCVNMLQWIMTVNYCASSNTCVISVPHCLLIIPYSIIILSTCVLKCAMSCYYLVFCDNTMLYHSITVLDCDKTIVTSVHNTESSQLHIYHHNVILMQDCVLLYCIIISNINCIIPLQIPIVPSHYGNMS